MLTSRRDAGAGLHLVTLTPPAEDALRYRTPGQYIRVHAGTGGYFVLAGDIGAPSWELLVRSSGDAAAALTSAPEGETFPVSGPLGEGFPLVRASGKPLVVAVVGSAIAVARPIVHARIGTGELHATTIYVGVRTVDHVPLLAEVAGWVRAGARVVLCLSQPELDHREILPDADRRTGWVQRILEDDVGAGRVTGGVVFAAGPTAMLEEIRRVGRRTDVIADVPMLEVVTNV